MNNTWVNKECKSATINSPLFATMTGLQFSSEVSISSLSSFFLLSFLFLFSVPVCLLQEVFRQRRCESNRNTLVVDWSKMIEFVLHKLNTDSGNFVCHITCGFLTCFIQDDRKWGDGMVSCGDTLTCTCLQNTRTEHTAMHICMLHTIARVQSCMHILYIQNMH